MAKLTDQRFYQGASLRDAAMELEAQQDQGASYTAYVEEIWEDEEGNQFKQPISTGWQEDIIDVIEEMESYTEGALARGEGRYPGRHIVGYTNFTIGRSSTI